MVHLSCRPPLLSEPPDTPVKTYPCVRPGLIPPALTSGEAAPPLSAEPAEAAVSQALPARGLLSLLQPLGFSSLTFPGLPISSIQLLHQNWGQNLFN